MKKFGKLLLSAVCILSVLTCAACVKAGGDPAPEGYEKTQALNGKTTEQTYTEIMSKIQTNSTNFTSNINYNVDCLIKTSDVSVSMQMAMQVTDKVDGANLYERSYIDMGELMGEDLGSMTTSVWYIETTTESGTTGTAYLNDNGTKMKYSATWAQICQLAEMDSEDIFNPIYDFSNVSFDNISFYVDKNTQDETEYAPYFELMIGGNEAEAFVNKQLNNVGNVLEDASMSFSKIRYKFILNNQGAFDHAEVDYTTTMTAMVEGVKCTYEYTFDGEIYLTNLGTTNVTAPSDAKTYRDYGKIDNEV